MIEVKYIYKIARKNIFDKLRYTDVDRADAFALLFYDRVARRFEKENKRNGNKDTPDSRINIYNIYARLVFIVRLEEFSNDR